MIRKNNVAKRNTGFTLIETLISVVILLIAVVGPMRIASQGISSSIRSRDELVAAYLAQDAIEFIRYKIITNQNANDPLTTGLGDCLSASRCNVDTLAVNGDSSSVGRIVGCGASSCPDNLKLTTTSGGFTYYGLHDTTGTSTDFRREVTITEESTGLLGFPSEWYISATVYWGKLGENSLTVGENLVDWRVIY